jgi:tripartite-type tricarboxylate transporter receptor subunit TctC
MIDGRFVCRAIAALLTILAATNGWSQSYPSKPVRILTGFPPGGPTELIGRVVADHLTKAMGQPFYIEGKPGAAGNVAGEILASSPPDGHTLYLAGMGVMAVNHALYPDMKFDTMRDFAPVTVLVTVPLVLEVSTKLPVATYAEFVAYARQHGARMNYGSPGIGTLPHLAGELMKSKLGFQSTHVAYRGRGPVVQAIGQHELQWALDEPHTAGTLVKNGAVRVLAVAAKQRSEHFPDVPTLAEAGLTDSDWTPWFGLVAPRRTPKEIVDRLSAEVGRGFGLPENIQRLRNAGYQPATTTPEGMTEMILRERARWPEVVRANQIKVE